MLGFHISPCIFLITYLCSPIIDKSKYYGNTDIIHFEHLEVFSKIPLLDIILISIFRRCSWWFLVKMESFDTHLCHWNLEKIFRKDPFGSKKKFLIFFRSPVIRKELCKKLTQNFFSSRKVTFGHFFEKKFCPRWQVENSTMTLKFWALRSKGVKTSLGARITLVMSKYRGKTFIRDPESVSSVETSSWTSRSVDPWLSRKHVGTKEGTCVFEVFCDEYSRQKLNWQ